MGTASSRVYITGTGPDPTKDFRSVVRLRPNEEYAISGNLAVPAGSQMKVGDQTYPHNGIINYDTNLLTISAENV
jgi:hypothetical protein